MPRTNKFLRDAFIEYCDKRGNDTAEFFDTKNCFIAQFAKERYPFSEVRGGAWTFTLLEEEVRIEFLSLADGHVLAKAETFADVAEGLRNNDE